MIRLTTKQVISIHSSLIEATGGTDGVRDMGLLESALEAPFQTFGGKDLYPALIQKAARLGHSLISNHPFVDGNKRIGIHTMLVFLAANGVEIECTQKELIDVGLSLADGTMNAEKLLIWLSSHN
ncbi:MAG: type II toxin-antitoxin system death-on-curing family toxin [Oscillospiraceae bacterium]|nr:type II toxin-antitoxin system death-on-curing family toxin [Ruminococcus sp.]MDD5947605.1 type II toxin-antitoxin system death-on-curing family toxin [Oscillospiraceae bacterium]